MPAGSDQNFDSTENLLPVLTLRGNGSGPDAEPDLMQCQSLRSNTS